MFSFDVDALLLAGLSVLIHNSKAARLVFLSLLTYFAFDYIGLFEFNQWDCIFIMLIELSFLYCATKNNLNLSLSVIFLISIVYNGLTFIAFNSTYSLIYDNYAPLNQLLVAWMIITINLSGIEIGRSRNSNKPSNGADNIGGGSFSARSKL